MSAPLPAQLAELARVLGAMDRYAQRAGLLVGPLPALLVEAWACHEVLAAEHERTTRMVEELQAAEGWPADPTWEGTEAP